MDVQVEAVEHLVGVALDAAVAHVDTPEGDGGLGSEDRSVLALARDKRNAPERRGTLVNRSGERHVRRKCARAHELAGGKGNLRRVDVTRSKIVNATQRLVRRELPGDSAVSHEAGRRTVLGDEVGVVLDDDDRLAVLLVELAQDPVSLFGVIGIELGYRLVKHDDVGLERNGTGEREQVLLSAG